MCLTNCVLKFSSDIYVAIKIDFEQKAYILENYKFLSSIYVKLVIQSSSTMYHSKEQKIAVEVSGSETWSAQKGLAAGTCRFHLWYSMYCSVYVCVYCENKGFLPKTCKGQHASLVLSARGKALDSLCRFWKHSPSHCHMCVFVSVYVQYVHTMNG